VVVAHLGILLSLLPIGFLTSLATTLLVTRLHANSLSHIRCPGEYEATLGSDFRVLR
jgi:hypothetical protein